MREFTGQARSGVWVAFGLMVVGLMGSAREAGAQGVAFQPTIETFPDGVMLNATPVVSADRRYVRFTNLVPQVTALQEFNVFVIPGAVGGGGGGFGGGFGGFGGVGGGGGGLGGGGAGFGSVPMRMPVDPLALARVQGPEVAPVVVERPARRRGAAVKKGRAGGRRTPQP